MVFTALSATVFGQFTFGVKAGYNTSLGFNKDWKFDASNLNIKSDLGHGFQAGIFMRIGNRWYAQPELYYNMTRTDYKIKLSDIENIDRAVTLSTVDLPIMVGYKIFDKDNFNMRVMLGPKFRFDAGSFAKNSEEMEDWKEVAKKAQIGLTAGIGFDFWFMTLDLRYDLVDRLYTTSLKDNKINVNTINAFNISLGWKIIEYDKNNNKKKYKNKNNND